MKLVRCRLPDGRIAAGSLRPDGTVLAETGEVVRPSGLLAPVEPTNIIGIGLNYRRHAEEGGKGMPARPMWFMKTTGAVQDPGAPIVLPAGSAEVDYEGELAVVLARPAREVKRAQALSFVRGYTCANDVSARDWQFRLGSGQFCHAKSYDTFCPLGPVLVTPDELPDPGRLRLRTTVNGEVRQDWTTSDMVFDVASLIEFLSADRTLPAGTVILTGTPHGVGYARTPPAWLQPGDVVSIEIEGIGTLTNPVTSARAEPTPPLLPT